MRSPSPDTGSHSRYLVCDRTVSLWFWQIVPRKWVRNIAWKKEYCSDCCVMFVCCSFNARKGLNILMHWIIVQVLSSSRPHQAFWSRDCPILPYTSMSNFVFFDQKPVSAKAEFKKNRDGMGFMIEGDVSIHSKSGCPGCPDSAENSNFPQKYFLRTRKLPVSVPES